MRSLLLFTSALGLAGVAQAQSLAEFQPAPLPTFTGTYSALNSEFVPANGQEGAPGACGLGRAYNNTALGAGFFSNQAAGNTIIDEGRIPSIAGGGPADSYQINSFDFAYRTDVIGGLDVEFSFWSNGGTCIDAATLGAPDATFIVSGLPSSTDGVAVSILVNIDLTGMEFNLTGDANGLFGDDTDQFSWGYKFLGLDPNVDTAGPFLAGDPANCAEGLGTFADTGIGCNGAGAGTGLGTADAFRREADGANSAGCFFFGGYDPVDGNPPFSSFYLALNTNIDNDDADNASDLGMVVAQPAAIFDTCCATTSGLTTCTSMVQDRFYSWVAPADDMYTVDTFGSDFDTKLAVLEGTDSLATCVGSNDDTGGLQSEVSFMATAGTAYLFQVGGFSGCGNAILNISDSCSAVTNDEPATAVDLGSALGNGLDAVNSCCATDSAASICGGPFIASDLYYTWTASFDGSVVLDTEGSDFDTRIAVFEGLDTMICVGDNDDGGTGLLSSLNFSITNGTTYLFQMGGFNGCGNLVVNVNGDPCAAFPDDALEDNDSQVTAIAIGDGTYPGLAAVGADEDFYNTVICDGDTLTVDILFVDAVADMDLRILDMGGATLDISQSVSDNEQVSYTNTTGASQSVTIRAYVFQGNGCTNYDLIVDGSCNIGTQYCDQNANSTGNVAQILVGGSIIATDGVLNLTATNMPVGEPGYFVWSTASGLIDLPGAGISDGFLCLGSGKGRFNQNVFTVDNLGSSGYDGVNMSSMPQSSMGPITIMAGDTGYFQGWFRDGQSNNFTDAASITWQ